ncbi:Helix-turn-helix domain-containing protein [Paenibacillus sp. UNCCL117]|uniref:helix-turn-helix domain-containing protein n=1 Tax=unclassified Paenibacillus TaxID=185978 RepID=UPI00088A12D8|nr:MULTISPECIES: helix-turn-helix domain-containing protein [unclassified Paenibacillus]SDE15545.1 Helix-turn-helix domain-containing protein [Paenibacillus sp. cl123]SFW60926.1 Helix-turn-helix domain-containing protein [Paenibacillus sp. UNCCL117]
MNVLFPTIRFNSLFFKMLTYFLIVIILLSSYNVWSFTFYTRNVSTEIVNYNRTLIRNTVESFETQFKNWKGRLLNLQHHEYVRNIQRQADEKGKQGIDYLQVQSLASTIRELVNQPYYHLVNVMIYYRNHSFLVEKDGIVNDDRMFGHYYVNRDYSLEYWKHPGNDPQFLQTVPSRVFMVRPDLGNMLLLPIRTNVAGSPYEVIAFVDMKKWYESYKGKPGSQFFLLDADGRRLFQSDGADPDLKLPEWDGAAEWVLHDETYYFYERGVESGFTYVTVIKHDDLNRNINRMNWIAVALFAATVLIGISTSLFFSRTINQPLKNIVTGLTESDAVRYKGNIAEFNAISDHLQQLGQERKQIKEWMDSVKPMLTSYHYMARFKKLKIDAQDAQQLYAGDGAFMILVHQIRYRHLEGQLPSDLTSRILGQIQEIIRRTIGSEFPLSHTFQMETHQILSIVYTSEKSNQLKQSLAKLKQIYDHDSDYYLVTISVSSLFQQSADFDQAYAEALSLVRQARPVEETQIIWEKEQVTEVVGFTTEQEQEFYVNLQAGNENECRQLIQRAIEELTRQGATTEQLERFADYTVSRIRRTVKLLKITHEWSAELDPLLAHSVTPDQYREALQQFAAEAAGAIQLKREENYDIIQYVIRFIDTHYAEDISLDMLAHKLNMSPAYLSGYIKEKTGRNFSDQLNSLRIAKAKELLSGTNLPIQEVGNRIGYRNVTSFIRMYKKETGQTPGDYRKTLLRNSE